MAELWDFKVPSSRVRVELPDGRGSLCATVVNAMVPFPTDPLERGENGKPATLVDVDMVATYDDGSRMIDLGRLEPGWELPTVFGPARIYGLEAALEWRRERDTSVEMLDYFTRLQQVPTAPPAVGGFGFIRAVGGGWRTYREGRLRLRLALPVPAREGLPG